MKHAFLNALAAAALAVVAPPESHAQKLRVVATTPDLAALAADIGGGRVDVTALAKPTEDPHHVDPKPSHIVTLNRADVLIEGGAELELGWLPPLLESSRNKRIAAGAPGRIVASEGIRMLEVPVTFDRAKGDVHARGNPHFLLDPLNAKIVAAQIAQRFSRIDAGAAATYKANLATFNTQLDAKVVAWQKQLESHRGAKLVTYHKDFAYLAERFKLDVVETLEPKPGISPSPSHIARVIETMRATSARVMLVQPYQNRRTAETVARQVGAQVLEAPQQPGVRKGSRTYFDMMDYLITTLATALNGRK